MNIRSVGAFFAGFLVLIAADAFAEEVPSFSECRINDVSNSPSTIAYDSVHGEALAELSTTSFHFMGDDCFKFHNGATCQMDRDGNQYSLVMQLETVLGVTRYKVELYYRRVPESNYYNVVREQYCRF